jgi:hypothetical protein
MLILEQAVEKIGATLHRIIDMGDGDLTASLPIDFPQHCQNSEKSQKFIFALNVNAHVKLFNQYV